MRPSAVSVFVASESGVLTGMSGRVTFCGPLDTTMVTVLNFVALPVGLMEMTPPWGTESL